HRRGAERAARRHRGNRRAVSDPAGFHPAHAARPHVDRCGLPASGQGRAAGFRRLAGEPVRGAGDRRLTRRIPWLTIVVFVVTAAFTAAQALMPELLPALRRQPSMVWDGQVWRFVTAWLVHDEGALQI